MTMFVESWVPIVSLGIIAVAMLGTILVSTRQAWALWAMIGVLVLVFAGVALERLVVTDVERVETALDGVEDALKANDLTRLLEEHVSPDAVNTRRRAVSAMGLVEITSAEISNLTVKINRLTSRPTARAEFLGSVRYEPRDPERIPYKYYSARFIVELRLEGDRWVVTDHIEYH
ncbi:MAG TPA: hypothetical protein VMY37_11895 [Thermoguttaceae bacterium]|nr:hypothetical protein [Thermoguttaceae bacterium]